MKNIVRSMGRFVKISLAVALVFVATQIKADTIFKTGFESDEQYLAESSGFESLSLPDKGKVIVASVRKDGSLYSNGIIPKELAAGWYLLEAEYKNEGFNPMGGFNLHIMSTDYKTILGGENVPAASEWSLVKIYFYIPTNGKVVLLLNMARETSAEAKIYFDNITISNFSFSVGENMLSNPDFAIGKEGELPACWNWDYHGGEENYNLARGTDGDYALIFDKTFRSGQKVLRVIVNPDHKREIRSFNIPLPETGTLTYSVWAKGEGENLSVRLSIIGTGYKFHIHKSFVLTEDWREYKAEGNCKPIGKDKQCWFRVDFSGSGKIYLADASLVWNETSAQSSDKLTASGWWGAVGKNMLLNPGFELGWAGWLCDYFVNQKIYTELTDESYRIIEKEGDPNDHVIYIPAARNHHLISTCFPIEQGKKYSLSADIKSIGSPGAVYMAVSDPGWVMYNRKIENISSDKWTRYTFTFVWDKPSNAKRAMVRFNNATEIPLLLDNVQFEEGEPTEYTPPPVMLGMMSLEGADNLFFYKKDNPCLILKVQPSSAAPETVKVQLVTKDAWGNTIFKKNLSVSGREISNIPIEFPANKMGVFEVRLQAEDENGQLLGLGISRYAIIDTPASQALGPDSLFGIGYNIPRWPFPDIKEHTEWMRKLGVGINRFFLNNEFYPVVVNYNEMERIRRQVAIQKDAGIKLIAVIGIPNALRDKIVYTDNPSPEALEEFAQHVRTYVSAFKDQIRYWEVLNEPNIWTYPSGPRTGEPTMPASKNIKLHEIIYREVKKIDPELKVVGICVDYLDLKYLKDMLELGVAKYMDVFSFHGYRSSPDLPEMYSDIVRAKELLKQYGFSGQMINDEQMFISNNFAFRTADVEASAGVDYVLPGDQELLAASYNIRNFIQCAAEGVPLCLYDPDYILARKGGTGNLFMFYTFGAYNAATRFLSDAGKGEKVKTRDYMRAFLFPYAQGGPLLAIYTPEMGLSGRIFLTGDFTAYDIMGNQFDVASMKDGLPLRNDPIYIRFKKGTAAEDIKNMLASAETTLSDSFLVNVSFGVPKKVIVTLTNRENTPLSGTVTLVDFPNNWVPVKTNITFAEVKPNETARLNFEFLEMPVTAIKRYNITVRVNAGKFWTTMERAISPFFAHYMNKIKIDGELDDWTVADWVFLGEENLSLNFNPELPHKGPSDLSAKVACGWNEEFFALAIKVEDDIDYPPDSAAMSYLNDSIQVYFDPLKNARPKGGFDSDDIIYAISSINGRPTAYLEKGTAGYYVGEQNQMRGIDRNVEVAIKRVGTTTVYEIKFPTRVLPNLKLFENASFGFSLLINDNDGEGRKQGLTISPKGTEPYKNPYDYPTIFLVK